MKEKMSFDDKLSMILDLIYYFEEEYNTNFVKDNLSLNVSFLVSEDKLKVRNEIFNEMIELFGYDGMPEILDDEEYFKLEPFNVNFEIEFDKQELWTASKDFFHNFKLVNSRSYYKGIYKFSNGIYSAPSKEDAMKYANAVKKDNLYFERDINLKQDIFNQLTYTIPFKMPYAKVIKDTDLQYIISSIFYDGRVVNKDNHKEKQLLNFVKTLYNDELKFKLAFLFENDLAKLAIILGYDAVFITKDYEFYFQVLNRSKMIFSTPNYVKSEYEMIFRETNFK